MGCTASAPTALDPHSAATTASASAANAAEKNLLPGDADGGETEMVAIEVESSTERAQRVLPVSDTVETSVDLDSRDESFAIATANDVHIIDQELDQSPAEDIGKLVHIKEVASAHKLLPEEPSVPPLPPFLLGPLPLEGVETVIRGIHSPDTDAHAEFSLETGQDTDTGENDMSDEDCSPPPPGSALERRPTRWEALTDVASELPPKLTVDPLTGQIYALKRD